MPQWKKMAFFNELNVELSKVRKKTKWVTYDEGNGHIFNALVFTDSVILTEGHAEMLLPSNRQC